MTNSLELLQGLFRPVAVHEPSVGDRASLRRVHDDGDGWDDGVLEPRLLLAPAGSVSACYHCSMGNRSYYHHQ